MGATPAPATPRAMMEVRDGASSSVAATATTTRAWILSNIESPRRSPCRKVESAMPAVSAAEDRRAQAVGLLGPELAASTTRPS